MDSHSCMKCGCDASVTDHGLVPFAVNITCATGKNQNLHAALWTGCHLQMTLMEIPPCCEIGLEMHTDRFSRVESGQGLSVQAPARKNWISRAAWIQGMPF